jgi:O-antigen/teichoic acid export membrane protein
MTFLLQFRRKIVIWLKPAQQFHELMPKLSRETLFRSDHLSHNLAQKSIRGGITTLSTQGVQFAVRLIGTVVLARLLTPYDFGLISMVTILVGFAETIKDVGLSMATIQKESITHDQISTLFWVNVIASVSLGMCVLAGSPLVAMFYGRPELTAITAALSISLMISGFAVQHRALLRRHMQFGTLAGIGVASQIITLVVTICMAYFGWRYWALLAGILVRALVETLLSLALCPWIPGRLKMDCGALKMMKFGSHIIGSSSVNYLSRNFDNILIGKYIGADELGMYSKAYQLFMMPMSQIKGPLDQVALPALSSLRYQSDRYLNYYLRYLNIVATLTIPLTLYCAIEADFLVRVLLGSQWGKAVMVFRLLALAGMIQSCVNTTFQVLISLGLSERNFVKVFVTSVVYIIAFILGLPYGINGIAAAYTLANVILFYPTLYYCFNNTPVSVTLFIKTVAQPFLIASCAALISLFLKSFLGSDSIISNLIASGVFFAVIMTSLVCRKSMREIWQ